MSRIACKTAGAKLDAPRWKLLWISPRYCGLIRRLSSRWKSWPVARTKKAVKVGLRGVNVEIYKVLKLVKLASRFSFLT